MGSTAGSKGTSALSYHFKQRLKGLRRKNLHPLSTTLDKINFNDNSVYKGGKLNTAEDNKRL